MSKERREGNIVTISKQGKLLRRKQVKKVVVILHSVHQREEDVLGEYIKEKLNLLRDPGLRKLGGIAWKERRLLHVRGGRGGEICWRGRE